MSDPAGDRAPSGIVLPVPLAASLVVFVVVAIVAALFAGAAARGRTPITHRDDSFVPRSPDPANVAVAKLVILALRPHGAAAPDALPPATPQDQRAGPVPAADHVPP